MKSWNIKSKLAALVSVLIIFIVLVGSFGAFTASVLSKNLKTITQDNLSTMRDLVLMDMVHEGVRASVLQAMYGQLINKNEMLVAAEKDLLLHDKNIKNYLIEIKSKEHSLEFQEKIKKAEIDLNDYLQKAQELLNVVKSAIKTKSEIKVNDKNKLKINDELEKENIKIQQSFQKFQGAFEGLESSLAGSAEYYETESQASISSVLSWADKLQKISFFGLGFFILCAIGFGLLISKSIVSVLTEMCSKLLLDASEIGSVVLQLSSASASLSSASQQQASALQQTSSSTEEISSMVKKSADSAKLSHQASNSSMSKAQSGQVAINQMVNVITDINVNNDSILKEVTESNKRIAEIVSVIKEIGNKTKVINEIVFQTKLLSFNASVEAARAGEHGKGFSVVAEEIGNLASMSGEAAKEITDLLEESQRKVGLIVEAVTSKVGLLMEQSKITVNRGADMAGDCSRILQEIVVEATEVAGLVSEISEASNEQSRGVEEISKAIHQLNEVNQSNLSASVECLNTTEKLTGRSNDTREVVAQLQMLIDGGSAVAKFIWRDEYVLHVPSMDEEHRTLISKINAFTEALSEHGATNHRDVLERFKDLAQYATKHFNDEEAFMSSIQFPELEAHKKLHKHLLDAVGDFSVKIENGKFDAQKLMNFLNDWLIKHILNVDMRYAKYSHINLE